MEDFEEEMRVLDDFPAAVFCERGVGVFFRDSRFFMGPAGKVPFTEKGMNATGKGQKDRKQEDKAEKWGRQVR